MEAQVLRTLMTTDGPLGYQMRSALCMGELMPAAFYNELYRYIYIAICDIHVNGFSNGTDEPQDVDGTNMLLVSQWLSGTQDAAIKSRLQTFAQVAGMELQQYVFSTVSGVSMGMIGNGFEVPAVSTVDALLAYSRVITTYYNRRRIIGIAEQLQQQAYDVGSDLDTVISTATDQLNAICATDTTTISTLTEVMQQGLQLIRDNQNDETRHDCIMTPFTALNETGGWNPVGLQLIVGDTGSGKSTLAMDFANCNLDQGFKVGLVNMEMSNEEVFLRRVCGLTGIPLYRLQYKKLDPRELELVEEASACIRQYSDNLLMDNHAPESIEQLMGHLLKMQREGCKVIYIDYLQILSWSTRDMGQMRGVNQEQMLASVARSLHQFALRYRLQVVLLSQVNRDRDNCELTLDRIRDSKQIADAAYGVLLINRPERYHTGYVSKEFQNIDPKGTVMLDQAKRRNGQPVRFIARFEPEHVRFADIPDQANAPRIGVAGSSDANVPGEDAGGMDDFMAAMNQY